jgi:hypothetical protein
LAINAAMAPSPASGLVPTAFEEVGLPRVASPDRTCQGGRLAYSHVRPTWDRVNLGKRASNQQRRAAFSPLVVPGRQGRNMAFTPPHRESPLANQPLARIVRLDLTSAVVWMGRGWSLYRLPHRTALSQLNIRPRAPRRFYQTKPISCKPLNVNRIRTFRLTPAGSPSAPRSSRRSLGGRRTCPLPG